MAESPLNEADRQAALAELRGILQAVKQIAGIVRYPIDDAVNRQWAAEVADAIAKDPDKLIMCMPNTKDDDGDYAWDYQPVAGIQPAALSRLCWLMGLTPLERAFVRAGLEKPSDPLPLLAYADYLRERGHEEEADGIAPFAEEVEA